MKIDLTCTQASSYGTRRPHQEKLRSWEEVEYLVPELASALEKFLHLPVFSCADSPQGKKVGALRSRDEQATVPVGAAVLPSGLLAHQHSTREEAPRCVCTVAATCIIHSQSRWLADTAGGSCMVFSLLHVWEAGCITATLADRRSFSSCRLLRREGGDCKAGEAEEGGGGEVH